MPATQAEVVAAVKTAAQHCVPLYPISRGKSCGYGDACPVTAGNVILDLSRWTRIRQVDPAPAYAVINPRVTQAQIPQHLRAQCLDLWPQCTGAAPNTNNAVTIIPSSSHNYPHHTNT